MEYGYDDPCACPEGTGWDTDTMMCVEGSTTRCWECPDMEGCQSITCESAGCPDFMEDYTCQCNAECMEYGNCCADYDVCEETDCDACIERFARQGGCECWMDESCDEGALVPEGCDSCGEQAAEYCDIPDESFTFIVRGMVMDTGCNVMVTTPDDAIYHVNEELTRTVGVCTTNVLGSSVIFTCEGDYIAEHVFIDASQGPAPEEPDCSGDLLYTMPIYNGCNDYSWGSMLMVWEDFCMGDPEPEPTDGPSCSCDMDMSGYVTVDDFNALREEVRELQGSIGNVEADNNDVMSAMEDMASCMSGIVDNFGGDSDSMDMTDAPMTTMRERTTTAEPTKMPSVAPSAKWEMYGSMLEGGNNKCSTSSADRSFRLDFTSLENCLYRCMTDDRCNFASTNHMTDDANLFCIGCINLNRAGDGWTAYEILDSRRRLSEVEQLRRENAALKAELARRN